MLQWNRFEVQLESKLKRFHENNCFFHLHKFFQISLSKYLEIYINKIWRRINEFEKLQSKRRGMRFKRINNKPYDPNRTSIPYKK